MAFEIYRTSRTISGQSANVIADYDVSTGGREMGRAISGVGSVLMSLGKKWDLEYADTQFTKAKAQAREEHNRFLISLEKAEPDDFQKIYDESIKKREMLSPKNKRAARAYNNWLTSIQPYWNENKNEYMKARIRDDYRAVGFTERQRYIETGNDAEYFVHLEKGIQLGAYSREEAAKYKQYAIDDRMRFAKTQTALSEQRAKEELELKREEDRDNIYGMIRKGENADSAIEASSLSEKEQESMYEHQRLAIERRARGDVIVNSAAKEQDLLDMAASINWPDNQMTPTEVKARANEARFGRVPTIDDAAYGRVRAAIRAAEEDKMPFTEKHIETVIGGIITGSPYTISGMPLPTVRDRESALDYATREFGRYATRVPGVMETINAKFPPQDVPKEIREGKSTPAYDFDGELIGAYNPDGSIILNQVGARRLWEIAGRDKAKARELARQNRYILPEIK